MNSISDQQQIAQVRGYLEGYYGKLLSWSERTSLVECLASLQLSTYCYAPKEDALHRLHWRKPYSTKWHQSFAQFCRFSGSRNISITAGIAPGLDFKFDHNSKDFDCLYSKAIQFLDDGCDEILILWDDIDEGLFDNQEGVSEGAAHADVVNRISAKLGRSLWTVPRVYAAEIENQNSYLEDFFIELQPQHTVLLCGNAIVAGKVCQSDLESLSCYSRNRTAENSKLSSNLKHRTVVWDNFYANDYCPRRLFLGPWTGREEISEYLINPTGMPYTDQLLLDMASSTHTSQDQHNDSIKVLKRHGVPEAFQAIAPYFSRPFFGDRPIQGDQQDIDCIETTITAEQAIEECLWKWKSPLAREWYPFIFGLKHDLALMQGTLPRDRVLKTQTLNLARRLLS